MQCPCVEISLLKINVGKVRRSLLKCIDRFDYTDEKAQALERLAGLLEQIINPAPADVVPLVDRKPKKKESR